MSDKKSNLLNASLTYGAYLGIGLIALFVIAYIADLSFNKWVGYFNYVIIGVGIYFAARKYRKDSLDGIISYGNAFGFSLLVAVFAGVISSFFTFIFVTFIDTEYISKALEFASSQLQEKGYTDEQIEQGLEIQAKMMTPTMMFVMGIVVVAVMGAIISLITSIFVKKEAKPFDFKEEI